MYRSTLVRLTNMVNSATDGRALIKRLAEEGAQICGTQMASVYLYNDEGELDRAVSIVLPHDFAREIEKMGRTQWTASDLVHSDRPATVRTVTQPPFPSPIHKLAASESIVWMVAVPMIYLEKLIGILLLFQRTDMDVSEAELNDLQILGNIGALAIAHLRLVETRQWEQKAQDQFLDMLSHELRTPLTSIMGFTQIIRRRLNASRNADPRLRDQLDLLWAQAQRLHRLLDTFVDMSNIERGEFTIERNMLDVVAVLNVAIEQTQMQARSKQRLNLDIPDTSIMISGDSRRLQHAFIHIISNALRYSPADHPIVINCEIRDNLEVAVCIQDFGPGITTELRREIFKRFYPSDARKAGGMGMGLYFSRTIIEAHGGKLVIDSAPGAGTTVTIILPLT